MEPQPRLDGKDQAEKEDRNQKGGGVKPDMVTERSRLELNARGGQKRERADGERPRGKKIP